LDSKARQSLSRLVVTPCFGWPSSG